MIKPAPGYETPKCDSCGMPASHTVYNERNTMTFICRRHAAQLLDDQSVYPEMADDLIMVDSVELTDPERAAALTYWNLIPNGAHR